MICPSFVCRKQPTLSLKTYLDYVVPLSAKRADHILADLQATKNDLVELYGLSEAKITVLLSGVDSRFRRPPQNEVSHNDYANKIQY